MSDTYSPPYGGQPGLDPNYQQALLMYLMGMGGLQLPPELQAMGLSTQPSYTNAQMDSLTGAVPGQLNPTQQANYLQDVVQMQVDPAIAAMYGAGAYSPDAFAPEVTMTPIVSPGRQRLESYVTNAPGSIEAYFAEQILNGGTASQAVSELRTAYEADPENPEVGALMSQLMLPTDEFTGELDWGAAQDQARALEMTFLEDPTPGAQPDIIDPVTGQVISSGGEIVQTVDAQGNPVLMRVETEDSPMAEWYRERGLSLPTEEYQTEDFLGQDWARGQAEFDQTYNEYQQQYQQWLAEQQAAERQPSAEADAANLFAGGVYMGGGYEPDTVANRTPETRATEDRQGNPVYNPYEMNDSATIALMEQANRQANDETYYDRGPNDTASQAEMDYYADPMGQAMAELVAQQEAALTAPQNYTPNYDDPNQMGPPTGPPDMPWWAQVAQQYMAEQGGAPRSETPTSPPQSEQGSFGFTRPGLPLRPRDSDTPTSPPQSEQGSRGRAQTPTSAPQSEQGPNRGAGREAQNAQLRFLVNQAAEAGADIDRERGRGQTRGTYDRDFDYGAWKKLNRSTQGTYGADYGRAAAAAFLLRQQGVTPLQQQLAARRQVPIGMGLAGSGYLPGIG